MMKPSRAQWGLALVLALLVHLALAALLERPGPVALDGTGVRIALGGSGPAGGNGDTQAAESAAPLTETLTPVSTIAETVPATAPPPPVQAPEVSEPLDPATKAASIQRVEPSFPKTEQPARAGAKPRPRAQAQRSQPPAPKAAPAHTGNGDPAGKPGSGRGGGRSEAGADGDGGMGGAIPGGKASDRYHAQLAAWLERHKRYPQRARQMRQEGVVRVRFVIDRSGKVISHRVEKSSGHAILDGAASDLLRRASPMPAIPADMDQSRLEIVVPITYRLR